MTIIRKNKNLITVLSMLLTAILVFSFVSPANAMAAKKQKMKLKGIYWDHQVKTADKKSGKIQYGKTYRLTLNADKRHPGDYNGIVRFTLPKYGQYKITTSNLKGASYVCTVLYKKYNYGIGYASYISGKHIDLVSQAYYDKLAYENSSSLKTSKVGKATSKAILESSYHHYIYFMSDGKASFDFKITK
jgi:hypothetical protein